MDGSPGVVGSLKAEATEVASNCSSRRSQTANSRESRERINPVLFDEEGERSGHYSQLYGRI